jgi:AcrR family transcriptional regulator
VQKRAIQTKSRILKAALRLFARYGFHGTTIDRIAVRATANKERIYGYFGSKRGLFEACLVSEFEAVSRMDDEMLAGIGENPSVMTETLLRHYLHVHQRFPEFWRLLAWANLEPEPFYRSLKNIKEGSYARLRCLYVSGQECGVFRKSVSFEVYLFALLAVTYFYHSNRRTLSSTLNQELFTETGAERLILECSQMLA